MGAIFSGATRLLLERPGSVLLWGAAFSIGVAAIALFDIYVLGPLLLPPGRESMWAAVAFDLVRRLLSMLIFAFVGTAVFRAVIWREQSSWFSLRVGKDEGRVYVLMLLLALLQFAGGLILGLLHVFATSLMGFLSWGNATALTVLTIALNFALFGLLIWVSIRLSPALPLAVVRRRISIDGAWDISRGRFWRLLGGYLAVGLVSVAIAAAVLAPFFGELFLQLVSGGDPYYARYAVMNFAYRQWSTPTPILIGEGLAVWLALTVLFILNTAAVAAATRCLLVETGELEDDELY